MQISQSSVLLRNGQQEQFVEDPEKQKEVFLDFKKIDFKAPKFAFFQRSIVFVNKQKFLILLFWRGTQNG